MIKTIQIGDVFGDLKSVQLQDNQTIADALHAVGMTINKTQQLIANSTSQQVDVTDIPIENEVYLLTTNQTSGN